MLANPEGGREPVLPALSGLGAAADGAARHHRDRDRQPGGHHRRLFAHPTGDPAWPAAAARNPPHLGGAGRADLHAAGQLAAARSACCCWSCLFRSSSALASAYGIAVTGTMVVTAMLAFVVVYKVWRWPLWLTALLVVPFLRHRSGVPRRQSAQGARRRLGAAGARRPHHGGDVHVAARQPHRCSTRPARPRCRSKSLVSASRSKPPLRVPGTAVFLTGDPDLRADRAAAQPQALQGAAREERHPHRRDRRRAARRCRRACHIEPLGETFSRVVLRFGFMETPNVPQRAGGGAQARLAVRHHVDVVLPVAPAVKRSAHVRTCRAGRTGCSSGSPAARTTRPTISRSRPAGWSRSARKSRCDAERIGALSDTVYTKGRRKVPKRLGSVTAGGS